MVGYDEPPHIGHKERLLGLDPLLALRGPLTYLQQGGVKVWSSDACDPRHGSDVLTFASGHEVPSIASACWHWPALHVSTVHGFPSLQLLGLDPATEYRVAWIEGKGTPDTPASASGAWWMHHGIQVEMRGDYQAAAFQLDGQR